MALQRCSIYKRPSVAGGAAADSTSRAFIYTPAGGEKVIRVFIAGIFMFAAWKSRETLDSLARVYVYVYIRAVGYIARVVFP